MSVSEIIAAHPGLEKALCAVSFFRHRNDQVRRFRTGRRRHQRVTNRSRCVQLARQYIQDARKLGWRGSITEALSGQEVAA